MGTAIRVANSSEVPPGSGKTVDVNGRAVALFNVDGAFYAVDNVCPHAGGPIGEGAFEGHVVTCPWHAATFDVRTGRVLSPPARSDLRSYPVQVEGEEVLLELE